MTSRKPSARPSAAAPAAAAGRVRKSRTGTSPPAAAAQALDGDGRQGDEDQEEDQEEALEADAELDADPIEAEVVTDDAGGRGPARTRRASTRATSGTELAVVRDDAEDASSGSGVPRDALGRFMSEVRRHPRLSEAEERELGKAVREHGDVEAARRLVVHNLRLVVSIAHHYRRAWANILDLFQEGSVGLMEAVKRWEPTLGPRFGSYAAYWIRAYVLKFLMTNSRLIHVGNTRAGRKLFFRLERERQKLLAEGYEPTPKLLAAKLDVDEDDLNEVRRHLESREVSYDPQGTGDGEGEGGYPLTERIPLQQASPEEHAASAEMSGALHEVMDDFRSSLTDPREREVWSEHLAASEPVPLGEIGARFGVSKQRMGQIADGLKKRFRERIVARMGPDIRTDWLGGEE
jgi:RNA polymerase sigma-32 factor